MHIISGFKKRCLGPASAGAAATGEAASMPATEKSTAKEIDARGGKAGSIGTREGTW